MQPPPPSPPTIPDTPSPPESFAIAASTNAAATNTQAVAAVPARTRRGPARWQRLLPRLVAAAAVLAFGGAIVFRTVQNQRAIARSDSVSAAPDRSSTPHSPENSRPAANDARTDVGEDGAQTATTDLAPTQAASDMGEAATVPTYRSRMLGAFGALVDQQSEVFGDSNSGVRRELDGGLAIADEILADARTANRRAIRDANRQVRLVDRSPALLMFLVPGLSRDLIGCYRDANEASSPSPAIDRLARGGMRSEGFSTAYTARANGSRGASPPASVERSSAEDDTSLTRLAELLWESGYSTRALGATAAAPPPHDSWWDSRFGWTAKMVNEPQVGWPFPTRVLADERTLRIANQRPFAAVLLDEATSVTQSPAAGSSGLQRPVALVVRTPLAWWRTLAAQHSSAAPSVDGASESQSPDEAAVRELDRFIERLIVGFQPRRSPSTLVVIVGVPSGGEPAELPTHGALGPLVVHWPSKVPAGLRTVGLRGEPEFLASIADLIQSTRRSTTGRASSPWTTKPLAK